MLRISKQAEILLENIKDIDLEELERWFNEESTQTIVGSATITAYLMHKKYGN